MGTILGLGMTHYPPLAGHDAHMADILRRVLRDPGLPPAYRQPEGWPAAMRQEYGDDGGTRAAAQHRHALVTQFRKARQLLDAFAPDLVLIWGDDQYENFLEDVIPAFCVLAYDTLCVQPWASRGFVRDNVWGESKDTTFTFRGHRAAAKALTAFLLEAGFDVAYAYRPLHHPLGHAFLNTLLFLDYDRQGFPYPVLPFQVNCYGRRVVAQHGGMGSLAQPVAEAELDPPSPMPWRCFDLGAACARFFRDRPWRVALIASSSWSHAFLTAKHYYLYPDIEADRALFAALQRGDYATWRQRPLAAIEESGQQEVLNWMCLVGAMAELGRRPQEATLIESYIFNSNKCFAFFLPEGEAR
ncbi:MAG: hypothetical protein KatS3mg131_3833 [Candidatus Tectimicrobiota bacterium]|nr:MAG: hypothetical protein KatS3mg131_3833 [Candidatus Tectomicrobia bacterium]